MNKVREGYKMTEIGEIPEEWEVSEIGKYIENISKKNKDLNIQHVVSVTKYNGIVDSLEYFDKQVFSKDISNYKIIKKDEFAYSTIHLNEGAIGYLKHCENAVLSPMYTVFKVRNDLVNNYFLYNLLKSNKYINIYEMLGEGSVDRRSSIPFNKFKEIKVAMPPIEEQEKISSILSTVDEQIDNVDALIEKNKELKKGLMQTLLTKGIGHTKFKKTEIGEIPEEWEVSNLTNIVDIKGRVGWKGYTKKDLVEFGPLAIGAMHINSNNKLDLSEPVYLSKEKYEESPEIMVSKGDIILAQRGSLGKVVLIEKEIGEATINPSMVLIKNIKINSRYLYYFLCSEYIQKVIFKETSQTSIPMISQEQIGKFKIIIPTIKEQEKIASILSEVDKKIEEYENKKQKLEKLKKGLMQQLLTGKIRAI